MVVCHCGSCGGARGKQSEKANILPLEAGAHYKWDRFNFAVRPIDNVYDTGPCRLWIQMVWLNNTHESGELVSGT